MEQIRKIKMGCSRRTAKPINCIVSNRAHVIVEGLEGILAGDDKRDFFVHVISISDHKTSLSYGFLHEFEFLPAAAQGR